MARRGRPLADQRGRDMTQPEALDQGGSTHSTADREAMVRQVGSAIKALIRLKYFSFEVEGVEHLPRVGPVVYALNHAGWFALDTIMLGYAVSEAVGVSRTPYYAAHESALA